MFFTAAVLGRAFKLTGDSKYVELLAAYMAGAARQQRADGLFWHHVFATGWTKRKHTPIMVQHIEMLRRNCLGNLRTLLIELSRDPAMIYWLDNCENHRDAPTRTTDESCSQARERKYYCINQKKAF